MRMDVITIIKHVIQSLKYCVNIHTPSIFRPAGFPPPSFLYLPSLCHKMDVHWDAQYLRFLQSIFLN